jgi:hypothetical protein
VEITHPIAWLGAQCHDLVQACCAGLQGAKKKKGKRVAVRANATSKILIEI